MAGHVYAEYSHIYENMYIYITCKRTQICIHNTPRDTQFARVKTRARTQKRKKNQISHTDTNLRKILVVKLNMVLHTFHCLMNIMCLQDASFVQLLRAE